MSDTIIIINALSEHWILTAWLGVVVIAAAWGIGRIGSRRDNT